MKATPSEIKRIAASALRSGWALMGIEPTAKAADKPQRPPPGDWGLSDLTPAERGQVAAGLQALADDLARSRGRPSARAATHSTARAAAMPSTARAAAPVATIGRRRLTGGSMTQAAKDRLTADTWARLTAGGAR